MRNEITDETATTMASDRAAIGSPPCSRHVITGQRRRIGNASAVQARYCGYLATFVAAVALNDYGRRLGLRGGEHYG
jgi:hypothetical protein